jgi:hypothetical protein
LKFGDVVPDGWYFEASEDFSTRIVLSVPRNIATSYQFLRVSMDLAVAKGTRLNPDFGAPATYPQELVAKAKRDHAKYIVSEQAIKPLSQIDYMIRGRYAYASVVDLQTYEIPVFYVCIDGIDRFRELGDPLAIRDLCKSSNPLQGKLLESYGLSGAGAQEDFELARSTHPLRPFTG